MAEDDLKRDLGVVVAVAYADPFKKALNMWKKKDRSLFSQIVEHTDKIIQNPFLGKPLRYSYKNNRRIHIGSFVLVYEFHDKTLRFIDFDHHDKIYKKYK